MSEAKAPNWLRTFDVCFGLIQVILSVVVLAYQELVIMTMIFVLSFALMVIGIARIFGGIFEGYLPDGVRALNFVIGFISIIVAIVALLYTNFTVQVLIYILSFVLLLNGVARLVIGGFGKVFPKWLRGFFVAVGALTIMLSVVVFVAPSFGFLALILILSLTFLFNGVARIVQGLTGTQETEEY